MCSDSDVPETLLVLRDTGLVFLGSGELSAYRAARKLTVIANFNQKA